MDRLLSIPRLDGFTLALITTVAVASVVPASGHWVAALELAVKAAVMLLFFLHGARLAREAILQALLHWRLQTLILALTFGLFPLLGWATAPLAARVLEPSLAAGLLFLCCLPATVQSAIAFTSIARGNVPAAACAASASNLLGILVTPILTGMLLAREGSVTVDSVATILILLLLPFLAGQVARPLVGAWVVKRRRLLAFTDRGSILLMVYSAFSKAVVGGVWTRLSPLDLALVVIACLLLLAVVIAAAVFAARRLGFSREDEATILFCGSMKSLVTGLPMANVLFPASQAAVLVLPLIIFHQVQLLVCAVIARRSTWRRHSARAA